MNLPTQTPPPVVHGLGGAALPPPRPGRPPPPARPPQWAAWAFLAPVTIYLVAFYAYPLYRNLDLSLRDYTVRSFVQGDAPFIGLDNYRDGPRPTRRSGRRCCTPSSSPLVSLVFQFTIGLALAVFFHQHFRLSAHAAGAVPRAVAAAADRVGVDLVVDAQQRLRRRQRRARASSASTRSTGSPRRTGRWSR